MQGSANQAEGHFKAWLVRCKQELWEDLKSSLIKLNEENQWHQALSKSLVISAEKTKK